MLGEALLPPSVRVRGSKPAPHSTGSTRAMVEQQEAKVLPPRGETASNNVVRT